MDEMNEAINSFLSNITESVRANVVAWMKYAWTSEIESIRTNDNRNNCKKEDSYYEHLYSLADTIDISVTANNGSISVSINFDAATAEIDDEYRLSNALKDYDAIVKEEIGMTVQDHIPELKPALIEPVKKMLLGKIGSGEA